MLQPNDLVVDARGSLCPIPVIETKKVLENHPGEAVLTLVDNEVSRDNVKKFAVSKGYSVEIKEDGPDFAILMSPAGVPSDSSLFSISALGLMGTQGKKDEKKKVFLLTKNYLGEGSVELGKTLMSTFLFSLSEAAVLPEKILFINGAVTMVAEGSEHAEALAKLKDKGVKIEACGICLDFYGLKEKVVVGDITNMYVIVEALTTMDAVTL